MTTRLVRFCVAAVSVTLALAVSGPAAWSQTTPAVTVNPTSGAPGTTFTITMTNYKACPAATPNCVIIDFIQGATTTRIGTADSRGSATFAGQVKVPPGALPGPADVRAHVDADATQDAKAGFTVVAGAVTTTTAATTTTTASTTSTTLLPPTSTTEETTTTTVASTTTTTLKKDDDKHSDVPRYIAVALVVAAALATAIVDSRMRRLRG